MRRTIQWWLAFLLISAPLIAQTPSSPFVPRKEITRASVLELLNDYRGLHGLAPLNEDPRLDQAANDRFRDMEEQEYYGHEGPDGRSPFSWLRPHGYDFAMAGENLASGFETAPLLVDSWMESTGHRANILSAQFEDAGIAVIDGKPNGRATGKTVVVIFAKSR